MTRIDKAFDALARSGKKGFIAYITAGDPGLDDTLDIVLRLEDIGVDIIELGIPFSDPLADGRVNQESATRALAAGTTPLGVFAMVEKLRARSQIPVMCYTYMNPFYARGFDAMVKRSADAGVDGLLFLDMPPEEAGDAFGVMEKSNVNNIALVTPTSPPARIKLICKHASGFIYCVSRTGVTGARDQLAEGAGALVKSTRKFTKLPVALGFGVSTPALAAESARAADAVVVGSAIVQKFHACGPSPEGRKAATEWVARMVQAVKEI